MTSIQSKLPNEQSSLSQPKIIKTIFILDKNRRYSFDVNQNITIFLLKKMIDAAANLNNAHLRIFHEGTEYTSYNESSLDILFPEKELIVFNLTVSFDSFDAYACGKSICFECVKSNTHKGHDFKEKYDYLQSGEKLVNEIFKNLNENISENRDLDIYSQLRDKIKITFFSKLKKMVEEIEKRLVEVLQEFINRNRKNIEIVKNNMISLKKNCGEGLDELKEKICIEDMMLDEEIFLTFDKKFKEIKNEKDKIIKDMEEYKQFKQQLKIISDAVEKIYNEIYSFLDKYLTSDIYMKIIKEIEKIDILPLNKKDIIYRILSDVKKKPILRSTKKKILNRINPIIEEKNDSDKMQVENDVKKNLEEKFFPIDTKYVCQPIEKTNKILVYDVQKEKVLTQIFNNNLFISELPENSAWINYKNILYISGGEIKGRISKNLLKYDPEKNKLDILSQIPDNKEFHSMCCDENNNLYLIGGLNNTVLQYNIEKQKWTTFKNKLNMQRNHPICLIKDNELFIFFGSNLYGDFANSYEKTNLNSKAKFILYNPEQTINLEYASTLETVEDSILFFGGKDNKGPLKSCLKFYIKSQKFEECPYMLNEPSSFHQNFLNQIGENCFGYFSLENNNFVKINFNYSN